MKLLIEKHPRLSVLVGDREKTNALEFDRVLVPVVGVFLRMDEIVESPLLENEWTIGDNIFRFRPRGVALVNGAVLKDDVLGHRIPGVVLGEIGKKGDRGLELDLERVGVRGADTHG